MNVSAAVLTSGIELKHQESLESNLWCGARIKYVISISVIVYGKSAKVSSLGNAPFPPRDTDSSVSNIHIRFSNGEWGSIFILNVSEHIIDGWVCKININPLEWDSRNNPGESEPIIQTLVLFSRFSSFTSSDRWIHNTPADTQTNSKH